MTTREGFENWCWKELKATSYIDREDLFRQFISEHKAGEYINETVNSMFNAWQAALSQPNELVPKIIQDAIKLINGAFDAYSSPSHKDKCEEVIGELKLLDLLNHTLTQSLHGARETLAIKASALSWWQDQFSAMSGVESEEFYNVCQDYRHAKDGVEGFNACEAYKNLIDYVDAYAKAALSQPNELVGQVVNARMGTYGHMFIDLPDETRLYTAPSNLEAKVKELEELLSFGGTIHEVQQHEIAKLTAKCEKMREALEACKYDCHTGEVIGIAREALEGV